MTILQISASDDNVRCDEKNKKAQFSETPCRYRKVVKNGFRRSWLMAGRRDMLTRDVPSKVYVGSLQYIAVNNYRLTTTKS